MNDSNNFLTAWGFAIASNALSIPHNEPGDGDEFHSGTGDGSKFSKCAKKGEQSGLILAHSLTSFKQLLRIFLKFKEILL